MTKFFYSFLLGSYQQEVLDLIDRLPVGRQEKKEALGLVNRTIHLVVVETILEVTDECYHERVVTRIQQLPDDRSILDLVGSLTGLDIEQLLRQRLAALQLDLLEDLSS